ncbi:alpha/beta hydrolase [Terrabacter tumescens]|uniref:Alpha/beta hydrolase n=1 Tax=Terrabacter tumescens TaxID=60443 RepID=A0ABQ2I762_9MICO|nr:alpha/beta fold hydrolase [Terrabacter tumescens]GGN00528.1 alpha/beta hydrolase [Terrabacter tumescens]
MAALEQRITTFSRDGLRFDVTDEGPVDGDVVVLLHGFPTDRTSWDRVAARLHEAGLRTLAPDQRGYSPGARPAGEDAYRLDELVADVLALIDASGRERVHLVGHDWGGALAWLVAGNHPTRIASLTVLSTPHPAAMSRAWRRGLDQKRRSWYMAAFQVPWVPERALAAGFNSLMARSGLPLEDSRRYAARLARPDALTGPVNWYRAARHSGVGAHRVEVPTTYVWGSRDAFLGRTAAELTREHVGADYELIELDAGHWLPETCDAESAAAILHRVARAS